MNKLSYLFTATTIFALAIFISCGPKDEGDDTPSTPSELEKQAELLVNGGAAREASSVKQGSVIADEWSGFTLTLTGDENGGSYQTSGRPDAADVPNVDAVWKSSGSWAFADSSTPGEKDPSKIVVDGKTMDVAVSASKLTLTFEIQDTEAGGRTKGVTGLWVFEF